MGRRFEQAHHEAAHCVAAIAQGLCVRWVTLAPVDNHAAGTHVERAIFSAADNPDAQIEALMGRFPTFRSMGIIGRPLGERNEHRRS